MEQGMTIEDLVKNYIALRDKKQEIEQETKAKVVKINVVMDKVTAYIMQLLDEQGVESAKTKFGTAYKTPKTQVSVADWDVVLGFVKEKDLWSMLTKGVSKTVVEEYLKTSGSLPPGVNYRTEYDVNVRAS